MRATSTPMPLNASKSKAWRSTASVHREDAHNERHYDFRPEKASGRTVKEPADERLVAMGDKLRTGEGRVLYGRRNHTVEPVFGIIKAAMGFRGFSLRGKEKVSGEWKLVCLAYNLKRLHRLAGSTAEGTDRPKLPSMGGSLIQNLPLGEWLGRNIHAIFPRRLRQLKRTDAPILITNRLPLTDHEEKT